MRKLLYWLFIAAVAAGCAPRHAEAISLGLNVTASPINLACSVSRTSGTSPLMVAVDCSATTSTATTKPFREIEFRFDGGDPGAGNWSYGTDTSASKNTQKGAGFWSKVYECLSASPCAYPLCVVAYDGTNTTPSQCRTITVTPADTTFSGTNTLCVAQLTTPSPGADGCPSGASVLMQPDFATAINSNIATKKRILFKHDDTFPSAGASALITGTGPILIGKYGTGAKPILQPAAGVNAIGIGNCSSVTSDIRIVDIDFDGRSLGGTNQRMIETDGRVNQLTVLRSDFHDTYAPIEIGISILEFCIIANPTTQMYSEVGIFDSTFQRLTGSGGTAVFAAARMFAMMGNYVKDVGGSHGSRINFMYGGILAHNEVDPTTVPDRHTLKIAGIAPCAWNAGTTWGPAGDILFTCIATALKMTGSAGCSQRFVVSDNKFWSGTNDGHNPQIIGIETQNNIERECISNIVYERNWTVWRSAGQTGLVLSATGATVRNNLFDLSGGTFHASMLNIGITRRGVEPQPTNIDIYNNSTYSSSAKPTNNHSFTPPLGTITVTNNVVYTPSSSAPVMFENLGYTATMASNPCNTLGCTTGMTTNPNFTSLPPDTIAKWKPTAGTVQGVTASSVPVWSDMLLVLEPPRDIGAINH